MYLGKELVTGTKIRKIQVQNLATGESDYYYFGEPCDEGDIIIHVGEKTHSFNREDDSPPIYFLWIIY